MKDKSEGEFIADTILITCAMIIVSFLIVLGGYILSKAGDEMVNNVSCIPTGNVRYTGAKEYRCNDAIHWSSSTETGSLRYTKNDNLFKEIK